MENSQITRDSQSANAQETSEQNNKSKQTKFKEGELINLVRVRFPGNARSFPFLIGKRGFRYGQKVIAMSDRGLSLGYINSLPYERKFTKSMLPLKSIAREANDLDIVEHKENYQREKKAQKSCQELIEKYKLDMTLTHVEFVQSGKKAVFYFTAPERVDFRNLVKELAGELHMRIELRQISMRDRAAALGSIGACGLQTCCSSFLQKYGNVGIKMAKNQNLALVPSKINGVCGLIKCCVKYEDDVYKEKKAFLPKQNKFVQVKNGDIGKVIKVHIIEEQFELLTDQGKRRKYFRSEYDKENARPPKDWNFPERLPHIVDETMNVIGHKQLLEPLGKTDRGHHESQDKKQEEKKDS